jgi:hypothetical protein
MCQAHESCELRRCRADVGSGVMSLPSYAGDGATMSMLGVACCRVMLAMAMALSSLASDGTTM